MNYDLINIKKKYGEEMMHFCRSSFADILEIEGLLYELISSKFAPEKSLYDDICFHELEGEFVNYIYSVKKEKFNKNTEMIKRFKVKTPKELLDKAGYDLYECRTEEDIQSFKKYYAKGESLCTFNGCRLNRCYVFFAVKKNVNKIKREDFKYPERQDEYGTSVISIQFTRGDTNTLSIKNRYNHRVHNPDATFSNNLENIIPGLTESFEKTYNLNISSCKEQYFEIPGYVEANDEKFYKYNYEIGNIYYCPNNVIIDYFKVVDDYQSKEKYIVTDYFIIDLVNKEVKLYDEDIQDSFIDTLKNIKKIDVKKDKETKHRIITFTFEDDKTALLEIGSSNTIISYTNSSIEEIDDCFLEYNKFIQEINIPNVKKIKNYVLRRNMILEEINLPNVEEIGHCFLVENTVLKEVYLPKIKIIGDSFLHNNKNLKQLDISTVEKIGISFLSNNECLKYIKVDNLECVGKNFLRYNRDLKKLVAPNLKIISDSFLSINKILMYLSIPSATEIGHSFLYENQNLIKIEAPNLKKIKDYFLNNNNSLEIIELPNLEEVGNNFMIINNSLIIADFPKLKKAGASFLYRNDTLKRLNMPNIFSLGYRSLYKNNSLEEINIYNLRSVDVDVLTHNRTLTNIDVPYLEKCDKTFLNRNPSFRSKRLVLSRKGKK